MWTARNEAEMIQHLDQFHRIDTNLDLHKVYHSIFVAPSDLTRKSLAIDMQALFLVCEWAVTSQRPAESRVLSAVSLLQIHSRAVTRHAKRYALRTFFPLWVSTLIFFCQQSQFIDAAERRTPSSFTKSSAGFFIAV